MCLIPCTLIASIWHTLLRSFIFKLSLTRVDIEIDILCFLVSSCSLSIDCIVPYSCGDGVLNDAWNNQLASGPILIKGFPRSAGRGRWMPLIQYHSYSSTVGRDRSVESVRCLFNMRKSLPLSSPFLPLPISSLPLSSPLSASSLLSLIMIQLITQSDMKWFATKSSWSLP